MVIRPLIAYSQSDKEGSEYIPIKVITVESDETFKQIEDEQNYLEANNEISEQLYQQWLAKRVQMEQNKRREGNQYDPCRCVTYARYRTGFREPIGTGKELGWAKHWPINSDKPVVGGVVITDQSKYGHTAYIEVVESDSFSVSHVNYGKCGLFRTTYKLNDSRIIGFWDPNI